MPRGERLAGERDGEGVAWAGVSQGSGAGGVACVGASGGGRAAVLAYYQV